MTRHVLTQMLDVGDESLRLDIHEKNEMIFVEVVDDNAERAETRAVLTPEEFVSALFPNYNL